MCNNAQYIVVQQQRLYCYVIVQIKLSYNNTADIILLCYTTDHHVMLLQHTYVLHCYALYRADYGCCKPIVPEKVTYVPAVLRFQVNFKYHLFPAGIEPVTSAVYRVRDIHFT
jgi:hypothetical protein